MLLMFKVSSLSHAGRVKPDKMLAISGNLASLARQMVGHVVLNLSSASHAILIGPMWVGAASPGTVASMRCKQMLCLLQPQF